MCKCNSESVDHLFLHCPVASELWDMVFGLFEVCWVMPMFVVGVFACWQGRSSRHHNGDIWKVVPLCLIGCIWKERNSKCFEDIERSMPNLKLLFFRTLTGSLGGETSLFLFWIYLTFVIFVLDLFTPVYFLCTWVPLSFDINESLLLIKKKKKMLVGCKRQKLGFKSLKGVSHTYIL